MPRNAGGTYALPVGNPVIGGTYITTAWGNVTMSDIAAALTDSLSRTGQGGMSVPFKNADGTMAAPGITWLNETNSGFWRAAAGDMRASVGGVDRQRWVTGVSQLWNGAAWSNILTALTGAPLVNDYAVKSIAQTITGDWVFNTASSGLISIPNGIQAGYVEVKALPATPASLYFNQITGAANEHWWGLVSQGTGKLEILSNDDAFTAERKALAIDRTGIAIASMEYGNATDNPPHTFHGLITQPTIAPAENLLDFTKFYNGNESSYVEVKSPAGPASTWFYCQTAPVDEKWWGLDAMVGGTFEINFSPDAGIPTRTAMSFDRNGATLTLVALGNLTDNALITANGIEVGYRKIPSVVSAGGTAAATIVGKCYAATSAMTIPANVFVAGDSFSIYNNSAVAFALTQGVGLTLRLVGSAATGSHTLAQRGMATLWFVSPTEAVVTGGGLT